MGRLRRHRKGDRGRVSGEKPDGKPATRLVTGGRRKEWTGAGVNPPVWHASTLLFDSVADLKRGTARNQDGDYYYGRRGTPVQWALAEALTDLEPGAAGTMLYPSGAAAVACALLSVLEAGDELLITDNVYDPSRGFADSLLKRYGVTTRYVDPMADDPGALFGAKTRAILLESPGSLTFEVQDVPAFAAAAKAHGAVTLLDNTWATSLFFPAIEKGVDISIVAGTKYIGGHSDIMLGCVTAAPSAWPGLRTASQRLGQCIAPDDAYLGLRGLRTLDVRLRRHEASGLAIAEWLAEQPQVARVLHPALPTCPGHDIWKRDFTGAAGLFSIVMRGGGMDAVAAMIDDLTLFGIGYSWGGFESLALPVHPEASRSATEWSAEGPVIRLSIGLEDTDDLIADLAAGLERFEKAACRK
ncbi:MAG: cystathionine beta-lyase [Parasphingopyxis sp.]|nr:cystathionine beta-lyase [Sphingomonadales bacterium]